MKLQLCNDDPIVTTLKNVLGANLIRVPNERIQPLAVIERQGNQAKLRGQLINFLSQKANFDINEDDLEVARMANLSGEKSRKVDINLGLKILNGFLEGFGVSTPSINQHFTGANQVSFSFENVNKTFIDNGLLGQSFKKILIDSQNPAAASFFSSNKADCLLVDSIITSNDFSITVEEFYDENIEFNIGAIQNIISNAKTKIEISQLSKTSISFKGRKALPFAFTCIKLVIDDDGKVIGMPEQRNIRNVTFDSSSVEFDKTMIDNDFCLIELLTY